MSIHKTAMIAGSSEIDPSADIGPGVIVEDNVRIHSDVKIMANVFIGKGTEIGRGTAIHMGAVVGHEPQDYAYKGAPTFTKIGENNIIREYVTIHRGTKEGSSTVIGNNCFIMTQCHIAHNCNIEDNVIMVNNVLLAGHVHIEKGSFISGNVVFHQFCRIGRYVMIGGFTGVNKDVPPYMLVRGPSVIRGINLVGLRRAGFKRETIKEIKEAYRIFFLSGKSADEALAEIKETLHSEEISHFVKFIEGSKRKICKYHYNKADYFDEGEGGE